MKIGKPRSGEWKTERGELAYAVCGGEIEITGYRGRELAIIIPGQIEGLTVAKVSKKAFLGNKTVKSITLPEQIREIGDWAFAYCTKLERLCIPYHKMKIGQGVFKECSALHKIEDKNADGQDKRKEDAAYLLAVTMDILEAFYLFDFEEAGKESWFSRWDAILLKRMERDDADGFSKMLLCGEEDYGSKENDRDYYEEQQRRLKVRLAMLRLMHDYGLEETVKKRLADYLLAHKKGQATEETWLVVLEEHGDEKEYYQFLIDCGCITEENFQAVMDDMGERHTEMKAFLMRNHAGWQKNEDAFAVFEL